MMSLPVVIKRRRIERSRIISRVAQNVSRTRTVIRESVEIFEAAGLFFETALT